MSVALKYVAPVAAGLLAVAGMICLILAFLAFYGVLLDGGRDKNVRYGVGLLFASAGLLTPIVVRWRRYLGNPPA